MTITNLRKTETKDLDVLQEISLGTFSEAFETQNTQEDFAAYTRQRFSKAQLLAELTHPLSTFYFAEQNQQVVGYLKVNEGEAQSELKEKEGLEIERIYVRRAFYRRKIGQQLLNKALALAQKKQKTYLWLGVWEKNLEAIRFYERNGFYQFDQHCFMLGNDPQTDLMMKRLL